MFQHWLAALCNQAVTQNSSPLHTVDTHSLELVNLMVAKDGEKGGFSLSGINIKCVKVK